MEHQVDGVDVVQHGADRDVAGSRQRERDAQDGRAKKVVFTADGLAWLQAFKSAVAQAEMEFQESVGPDVATVVALGLEAYAQR